jgi:D-sedoheptulose 7-phosphate isomerase
MLNEGSVSLLASLTATRLRARNPQTHEYFAREAARLARACRAVAERFERGGRLYAFGRGPYATDAAHVAVEFVHPVIVGKRALPALDISAAPQAWVDALIGPNDIALAFGPPEGDAELLAVLERARDAGALTFALPGTEADFAFAAPCADAHVHQEVFELLGHTLYESVHVFFEHRTLGHDVGASAFLYPYLGTEQQDTEGILADVTASILAKVHMSERLREAVAAGQSEAIARATAAIGERLARGGRILAFGNGGSATDATDFALDCVEPPAGMPAVPALSLACEPAVLSAIGNDVGIEVVFLRQIIAQSRPADVAFAFSTSGGSKNVVAALEEARKRGLLTVALLGYDGGEIARRGLADHAIVVRSEDIPRIQEAQGSIYHVMREGLGRLCDGA